MLSNIFAEAERKEKIKAICETNGLNRFLAGDILYLVLEGIEQPQIISQTLAIHLTTVERYLRILKLLEKEERDLLIEDAFKGQERETWKF